MENPVGIPRMINAVAWFQANDKVRRELLRATYVRWLLSLDPSKEEDMDKIVAFLETKEEDLLRW